MMVTTTRYLKRSLFFYFLCIGMLNAQQPFFQFGISALHFAEDGASDGINSYWSIPIYTAAVEFQSLNNDSKKRGFILSMGGTLQKNNIRWNNTLFNYKEKQSVFNIGLGIGGNYYFGNHLFDKGSIGFSLRGLLPIKNKGELFFNDMTIKPPDRPASIDRRSFGEFGLNFNYKYIGLFFSSRKMIFDSSFTDSNGEFSLYTLLARNRTIGITINPYFIVKKLKTHFKS